MVEYLCMEKDEDNQVFDTLEDALAHPAPVGGPLSKEDLAAKLAQSNVDVSISVSLPTEE